MDIDKKEKLGTLRWEVNEWTFFKWKSFDDFVQNIYINLWLSTTEVLKIINLIEDNRTHENNRIQWYGTVDTKTDIDTLIRNIGLGDNVNPWVFTRVFSLISRWGR